ncbi:DNA-formamidopyrimidine glycosylase family protein [Marivita sp.]|uniref:DNA-formamidopyrimidine glycosylase family protein n=1 Tax=Marivita sp. TaxID=2003365 RepID=UPI00344EDB2D
MKKVEVCRDSTVAFPTNKEEFIQGLRNSLIYKWDRRGKYLIAQFMLTSTGNGSSGPDRLKACSVARTS